MLITGFNTVDKGRFEGLDPSQVAVGVPARPGAGNGAQPVSVYAGALTQLLSQYPDFRGFMTWSIGWDETGGDAFVNAIDPIVEEANGTNPGVKVPTITGQPTDLVVGLNEPANLTVTAGVSNGTGSLSYQWYTAPQKSNVNGTPISNATSAAYSAPTDTEGTSYYYCVVTNTVGSQTASKASNAVSVTVINRANVNAQTPVISSQPADKTVMVGASANLTVQAGVSQGVLSYQWYVASSRTADGNVIINATDATYSAPTDTEGENYYYCIVTNTDDQATGQQTAEVRSSSALVKVQQSAGGNTWQADAVYNTGDIVVYEGQTYICKWWSQGDIPSASNAWEVYNDDGSNEYVPGHAYVEGDIVTYQGQTWRANWWTTAVPGTDNSWSVV
jgi:chitinase